jgi:hypothetical protein
MSQNYSETQEQKETKWKDLEKFLPNQRRRKDKMCKSAAKLLPLRD